MRSLLLTAALLLSACSARVPPAAVRTALMDADRAFAAATAADGLEGWMRFYARDAVRLRLGGPSVQGLAAVRAYDAPLLSDPANRLVWWPTDAGAFEDGRHGFTTGRAALVQAGGARDTLWRGVYITLWRREGRAWKVILDTGADAEAR